MISYKSLHAAAIILLITLIIVTNIEAKNDELPTQEEYQQLIEREVKQLQYQLLKQSIEENESITNEKRELDVTAREERCLARNIFFEAGIEPFEGKLGVAQVTWNRRESGRWGSDICSVVNARSQFSWTLQKKRKPPEGILWEESKIAARAFIEGARIEGLEGSLHYHADYVNPPWNREMVQLAQIGRHVFYDR